MSQNWKRDMSLLATINCLKATHYFCVSRQHKTELHFLDEDFKARFLVEMSKVAEAVYAAFSPDKLNYELLGNGDSHMHWHIFPRRESDDIHGPVWWTDRNVMSSEEVKPDKEELEEMKAKLYLELEKLTPILKK
jgi:diadenosine tetraphosphate (Ap4A) HIT family hydrolase